MIHGFKKWAIFEGFGSGEETFTENLDIYGRARNLSVDFPPGWEIEDGAGKITYTAQLDVRNGGIEDIYFSIDEIAVEIEHRVFDGPEDEDGRTETVEFVFNNQNIKKDPKIEVHSFPLYVEEVNLNFRKAENVDGEIDLEKVEIELTIGRISD